MIPVSANSSTLNMFEILNFADSFQTSLGTGYKVNFGNYIFIVPSSHKRCSLCIRPISLRKDTIGLKQGHTREAKRAEA